MNLNCFRRQGMQLQAKLHSPLLDGNPVLGQARNGEQP